MKTRIVLACLLAGVMAGSALAAGTTSTAAPVLIGAAEAKSRVGQNVVVEAAVGGVHPTRSGGMLIDINGHYPNNALTAVVFKSDIGKFSNLAALNGKTVRVSGTIKLYRGKPEIVLNDPAQLRVTGGA